MICHMVLSARKKHQAEKGKGGVGEEVAWGTSVVEMKRSDTGSQSG